jgi:hypothetical protein
MKALSSIIIGPFEVSKTTPGFMVTFSPTKIF